MVNHHSPASGPRPPSRPCSRLRGAWPIPSVVARRPIALPIPPPHGLSRGKTWNRRATGKASRRDSRSRTPTIVAAASRQLVSTYAISHRFRCPLSPTDNPLPDLNRHSSPGIQNHPTRIRPFAKWQSHRAEPWPDVSLRASRPMPA